LADYLIVEYFARLFLHRSSLHRVTYLLKNFTVSDIMISMHMLYRIMKGTYQFCCKFSQVHFYQISLKLVNT